jgi:hypothetical protein
MGIGRKCIPRLALLMILLVILTVLPAATSVVRAAGPCGETTYANGKEFCINLTKIITNPSRGLLTMAEPLYVAAYFPLPAGCDTSNPSSCGPESLPSGYQPLCNPCFHGGGLNKFPYHDHVISGAPGFGNDGTAGVMKGPWVLIIIAYDPSYSNKPGFTPFKSTNGVAAGELAGDFMSINAGASNPFEINTGIVVIFGVQPLS